MPARYRGLRANLLKRAQHSERGVVGELSRQTELMKRVQRGETEARLKTTGFSGFEIRSAEKLWRARLQKIDSEKPPKK